MLARVLRVVLVTLAFAFQPAIAHQEPGPSCANIQVFDDLLDQKLAIMQPTLASLWHQSTLSEQELDVFDAKYRAEYVADIHAGLVSLAATIPEIRPLADKFVERTERTLAAIRVHISEGFSHYSAVEKAFTDHDPFDMEGEVGKILGNALEHCRKQK